MLQDDEGKCCFLLRGLGYSTGKNLSTQNESTLKPQPNKVWNPDASVLKIFGVDPEKTDAEKKNRSIILKPGSWHVRRDFSVEYLESVSVSRHSRIFAEGVGKGKQTLLRRRIEMPKWHRHLCQRRHCSRGRGEPRSRKGNLDYCGLKSLNMCTLDIKARSDQKRRQEKMK